MAINDSINNAFAGDYNAPNKSSKNIIMGGDFTTNPWQLGTSFVSPAVNTTVADRFRWSFNTAATVTITKNADSPTTAQAGLFSTSCLQIAVTTADVGIIASSFTFLRQRIEGYDFTNIAQRTFTLSFWVNFNKIGIYCVAFRNIVSDRSYVAEYTVNAANTWQKITLTVPASPSAGTWDYTTGVGLEVDFVLVAGSNFLTTPNAWQTGNFLVTANQVNGVDSNTNIFKLALIQIESGEVATPFEQKHQVQVLLNCQRYYFKTFTQATVPAQNSGVLLGAVTYIVQKAGAVNNGQKIRFPTRMRVTPTVIGFSPLSASANWYNVSRSATTSGLSIINLSDRGVYLSNAQNAADVVGNQYAAHLSANAEL